MSNDPISTRGFKSVVPDDSDDPPRFAQIVETSKDAFVLKLREFFDTSLINNDRLEEVPTIRKYEGNFNSGLDAEETAALVIRKNPGLLENLPHIAILGASGAQKPLNIGGRFLDHVQKPPRVITTNVEPYALADGDTLVFRTKPDKINFVTSQVVFQAIRFPTGDPITAALASTLAILFNNQSLYARASVEDVGGLNGLKIDTTGVLGGKTPNAIEILSTSTPNLVAALGLADTGTGIPASGDNIGGVAPNMILDIDGAGFTAAQVGRNVVIAGATDPANNGTFPITAGSGDLLTYTNANGVIQANFDGTFFIGFADDSTNPARPVQNRYAYSKHLTISVEVITQDEIVREELFDLVQSFFEFFAEEQMFTFQGRSMQDENISGEHYQVIIGQDLRNSGEAETPRPSGDGKDKLYVNRIDIPIHTIMYIDRDVLVPSGPNQGQSFTLEAENVTKDDTLPPKN